MNLESYITKSLGFAIPFTWGNFVEKNVKSVTSSHYFKADIKMYLIIEQLNKQYQLPPCYNAILNTA